MIAANIASVRLGLTLSETARLLDVSEKTLFNWRKSGYGPQPVRDGARWLYDRAAIEAFHAGVCA